MLFPGCDLSPGVPRTKVRNQRRRLRIGKWQGTQVADASPCAYLHELHFPSTLSTTPLDRCFSTSERFPDGFGTPEPADCTRVLWRRQPLSRTDMNSPNLVKISVSVLCLVAAGCSSSDADQIKQHSRIVSSCSNSARMALNGWRMNQLPAPFVQQTLRSTRRNVQNAASKIEALRHADRTQRELVSRSLSEIIDLLAQAQNQVALGDHDTVQTATKLSDAIERLNLTSGMRRST